jgi:hypothetical protein
VVLLQAPFSLKSPKRRLNMLGEPADVPVAEPEAPKPQVAPAPLPNLAEAPAKAPEPVTPDQSVVTGAAAVPDFNGLDKRAVARISAERGVPVEMMGRRPGALANTSSRLGARDGRCRASEILAIQSNWCTRRRRENRRAARRPARYSDHGR